jgi:hypothetical protein
MTRVQYLGPSDTIAASEDAKPVPRGGAIDLAPEVIAVLKGAGHNFGDAAEHVEPNLAAFNDPATRAAQQIEADQTAKARGRRAPQEGGE